MLFVFLFFVIAGSIVVATPGAALGYAFVVTSRELSLWARIPVLLALAVASAAVWADWVGADNIWKPAIVPLSFVATLGSGIVFLLREAGSRRAPRVPAAAWPGARPPAA